MTLTKIKAQELEAGDVVYRRNKIVPSQHTEITLSWVGVYLGVGSVQWEGTNQYGSNQVGAFAFDELIEVTSR